VDAFKIMDSIIQGLVLLTLASTVTTLIATNGIPGLWLEDFAKIFYQYTASEVDDHKVPSRAAAVYAAKASQFFRTFDPSMTGQLDTTRLFDMLKVLLGADLNDEQLAALVGDIHNNADIDCDGVCMVDEFVQFQNEDGCDLATVAGQYKNRNGNPELLKEIEATKANRKDIEMDVRESQQQQLGALNEQMKLHRTHSSLTQRHDSEMKEELRIQRAHVQQVQTEQRQAKLDKLNQVGEEKDS